ncbi:MAG: hypothetical protein ABJF23_04590 [Bryobacteraceae bacterium]
MTLLERKQAELTARSASLTQEFTHWKSISESKGVFAKNHSQIRRIIGLLESVLRNIPAASTDLGSQRTREQSVLTVHSLWDFFRSKLTLRQEEFFGEYLRACDDFAWACYEPLRNLLPTESRREPPLVFLNGGWSPYAVPRDQTFKADPATGGWSAKMGLREVVEKLPLPMVGLPWFQVSHLPDTLVIAHEMGHIAEWDFGLSGALQQAVYAANLEPVNAEVWNGWKREVFADLYGVVCGGAAFAGSLADFLAGEALRLKDGASPEGDPHPHPWLRVAVVCEGLRQTGDGSSADRLAAEWQPEPGVLRKDETFKDDVKPLVAAILAGPYRVGATAGPLSQLIIPPAGSDGIAGMIVNQSKISVNNGNRNLVRRQLFAAARLLYAKDPVAYAEKNRTQAILKQVADAREPGVRGSGDTDLKKQAEIDERQGKDLAGALF